MKTELNQPTTIINKYTKLSQIYVGEYIDDRRGRKGTVESIEKTSLAWGLRYDFKLTNGMTITASE